MVSVTSLTRALQLGIASGIRSVTPLAGVSRAASQGSLDLPDGLPFSYLARPDIADLLALCAGGEMLVDKLPFAPSRTVPVVLLARMAYGASAAGLGAAGHGESVPLGTGLGALAAAWGGIAATEARKKLVRYGIPDPIIGLAEDALALTLTLAALPRLSLRVR